MYPIGSGTLIIIISSIIGVIIWRIKIKKRKKRRSGKNKETQRRHEDARMLYLYEDILDDKKRL